MPTLPGSKSYEKERPMKKYILDRQLGIVKNNQRLCIDLRGTNSCMPREGKLVLPSYKTLAVQFNNCHCTQFDLTAMYWSIPFKYSDQHKSNFWAAVQNESFDYG